MSPLEESNRLLHPWDFPGKGTGVGYAFQEKKGGGGGESKESTFRLPRAPGPRVPRQVSPEGQQGGPGPRIPRTLTLQDPGERRGPGRALPLGGGLQV